MLISHRKKFIFIKTVKTAGTSLESYFEPYCMPEGEWVQEHARETHVSEAGIVGFRGTRAKDETWYNHMPGRKIRDQIGDEVWNSYYKFTSIRNPYDKLVSYFMARWAKYQHQGTSSRWKTLAGRTFNVGNPIYRTRGDTDIELFRSWVKHGGEVMDRDKYMIDEQVCVDFFIRYEHLHNDLRQVCDHLSIPFDLSRLPKFKMGHRKAIPLEDYYDDKTLKIVQEKYAWELHRFNYSL